MLYTKVLVPIWLVVIVPTHVLAGQTSATRANAPSSHRMAREHKVAQDSKHPKQGKHLRDAALRDLRKWVRPAGADLDCAAHELLAHYHDVMRDTVLSVSQKRELRLKLRTRLLSIARRIEVRAGAQARRQSPRRQSPRPRSVPEVTAARRPMRQIQGGGPTTLAGGLSPAQPEASQQLVDLIRSVVASPTWTTNGGNGVIRYWQPGRALVVRQQETVHEDIANLLRMLRAAGR